MEFWTSGANEGELCELDQAHTWCSLGTRVKRKDVGVVWTDASKQPAATERCVTLQTRTNGSFGLNYSQCNATKSVLCEVYASIGSPCLCLILFSSCAAQLRERFLPSNVQRRCMQLKEIQKAK